MKIGIDCRKFYDIHANSGAGVERYVYHLVRSLLKYDQENDYVLFFYSDMSPETIHKVKGKNSRVKIVKLVKNFSKIPLFDSHWRFSKLLNKENFDITIFPANVIPLFYKKRSILIVHDLAIYLHPEWFPDKQWFATKVLVPSSLKRAEKIVTVSQSTKNDVMELFNIIDKKIEVIHPGVIVKSSYIEEEIVKVKNKFDITNDYILFIGTIEPRKNIVKLIQAFANYLFENDSEVKLVLGGVKGWKFQPIFQFLNDVNRRLKKPQIKYIGKVSDRERNILIKNSRAFVFPSRYEGFGFPVLEAMALGVPVVTSNNSSLGEIAKGAALLVDSEDLNELRRGIKRVLEEEALRKNLIDSGTVRVKQFTWEKTVKKLLEIIKK